MKKAVWSALKRKLQGMALGITGRSFKIIEIPKSEGELGYTSKKGGIHLASSHPIMKGMSEKEKVMFIEGVFAHELMHQLATDFQTMERVVAKHTSPYEKQVFVIIFNVMEDPAIEYIAPSYFGGHLLKALKFSIMRCYKTAPELQEGSSAFNEFINALIHYGDGGFVKGKFYHEEAKKCFFDVVPIFDKAIESFDGTKRVLYAEEVFRISKYLWEEEVKDAENRDKFMTSIYEALEQSGKSPKMQSGDKTMSGSCDSEVCEEEAKGKKKRRKITIHEISKEEAEEMGCGSFSDELPEGDIDVYVVKDDKSESTSEGTGEITSNIEDAEVEDESVSGDSSKADNSSEADDASETENETSESSEVKSANYNPSSNISEDSHKSTSSVTFNRDEFKEVDNDIEDTGEIDYEDCELTSEDIDDINDILDECKRESEKEGIITKEDTESLDIPEVSINYPSASCLNVRYSANTDGLEDLYEQIVSSIKNDITNLTNQLRRIFKNEADERDYRCTGRVNIKRLSSGRLTSRVFDRKKAPTNKTDTCVMLLIDESGSMCGDRTQCARVAAIGLAEVFGNLNIPISIIGFTADESRHSAVHYHYLHWKNTQKERLKLLGITARNNNFDGYSIRYASQLLAKRPEKNKLMIVISDGQPACHYYPSMLTGVADTSQAIREASKKVDIIGVAIDNSDTEILYGMYKNHFVHIANVRELFSQLSGVIKNKIKKWE